QIEEEQRQQEQQFNENYYSSVNSEQGATTSSDLYAEIGNGSGSEGEGRYSGVMVNPVECKFVEDIGCDEELKSQIKKYWTYL
ncbi:unnamed protein product, partial [Rotaria sp. Silwood2]